MEGDVGNEASMHHHRVERRERDGIRQLKHPVYIITFITRQLIKITYMLRVYLDKRLMKS